MCSGLADPILCGVCIGAIVIGRRKDIDVYERGKRSSNWAFNKLWRRDFNHCRKAIAMHLLEVQIQGASEWLISNADFQVKV